MQECMLLSKLKVIWQYRVTKTLLMEQCMLSKLTVTWQYKHTANATVHVVVKVDSNMAVQSYKDTANATVHVVKVDSDMAVQTHC